MATTFIFAESLTDEGCVSLVIEQDNQVVQGCTERRFEDIRQLQSGTKTVVVLPATQFTFHSVQLPWLGDKKARAALPYALEDQLAQNVDELHFAFDRQYYSEGRYLVVVSDKTYLQDIIQRLKDKGIDFDALTVDWFALNPHEVCVLPEYSLIHSDHFRGALTQDLQGFLPKALEQKVYFFTDTPADLIPADALATNKESREWLAERLLHNKPFDLGQGALTHGSAKTSLKHWLIAAAAMVLLWVTSLIAVNWIKFQELNTKIAALDNQIAVIYRQFFPEAKQVISPRFRITQYLKSNQGTQEQPFFVLLNKLAAATKATTIEIEQVRFQNKTLQVSLSTNDFASLEALLNRLKSDKVAVKQNQASTVEDKVVSTLELTL
ncbi:general secretion pathway protein GspL [Legionella taurinensis]|uniref:Type II secretion system protein L n=1 Tax=Legionella taurinensis TaxID=70611 RepID=A0A3A5L529_9GAMM|nr:type II secretion system protein GspL [Legionella taurinensis]MDX1837332.1 type II secretion system protein GspL [Legionella taurinensis]PUT40687.1 general secretion pathway protein GspL [Legionella taurinensis]PUT44109.1 general secretion pathway protein GspL [Legionella taurinensis]PUT47410.1 general secretion pathway protein GspL [Legionella taurinensis]PUT48549.1 general secretion pathway protein GspL [Legionella taurinensis]